MVDSSAISAQQIKYDDITTHYHFKLPIRFLDTNNISVGFDKEDEKYISMKHV